MEFAVGSNAIVNTVVIRTVMINDSYCIVFLCLEYFFLSFLFFFVLSLKKEMILLVVLCCRVVVK